jgi:hypothetical protein
MRRLLVIYAAAASVAVAQLQTVTGTINGVLAGEDGTALQGGSVVLHLITKSLSRTGRQRTDWTTVTGAAGAFQLQGLPEGDYTLCPRVPNSTWLNPCDWNFPTPTVTITRSAPTAAIKITLKRGAAVPIRINDSGQLLAQNEGKTPGAGFLLEVTDSRPGSFFRLVPLVSQDATGRNHQIVIPLNTPLTLFVHPTFYRVNDATGAPLSQGVTTKIPLLAVSGQQVAPVVFAITGH